MKEVKHTSGSIVAVNPLLKFRQFILLGFLFLAVVIYLLFHFANPINLLTADIGRHIKNGELISTSVAKPLTSNFYSYTMPDLDVINHHWGSGVIFYHLWHWGGFPGLSFFYLSLFLVTFLLFFQTALLLTNFPFALFFTIISIPLITDRNEIRPEGFSALLLGLYLFLLLRSKLKKCTGAELCAPTKALWIIPALQLLWVNLHIFFILGIIILAIFIVDAFLEKRDIQTIKEMIAIGIVSCLACLINPFGLEGALVPLHIFKQYGYLLAENQSVFFMMHRFPQNPIYIHFLILGALAILSAALVLRFGNWKKWIWSTALLGFFLIVGVKSIRGMSIFCFMFIPLAGWHFFECARNFPQNWKNRIDRTLIFIAGIAVVLGLFCSQWPLNPYHRFKSFISRLEDKQRPRNLPELICHSEIWSGLMPGVNGSADFFKSAKLEGPIFNNYDIGGYLIYHLFPKERVFVDNRPEAYTAPFFKDTYIPMQEDNLYWQKTDAQYNFNAIFFYRHDLTPWGQEFLINRIKDTQWAPVFVDDYAIIFLKRNSRNAEIIQRHELPKSMFRVSEF